MNAETRKRLDSMPPRFAALVSFYVLADTRYALDRLSGCVHPDEPTSAVLAAVEAGRPAAAIQGFADMLAQLRDESRETSEPER